MWELLVKERQFSPWTCLTFLAADLCRKQQQALEGHSARPVVQTSNSSQSSLVYRPLWRRYIYERFIFVVNCLLYWVQSHLLIVNSFVDFTKWLLRTEAKIHQTWADTSLGKRQQQLNIFRMPPVHLHSHNVY